MDSTPFEALRVGVVLDRLDPPRWILDAIRDIQISSDARIVQIFTTGPEGPRGRRPQGLPGSLRSLAYEAFRRLDTRLFRRLPDAFEPGDLEALLLDCPRRAILTERRDDGLWLNEFEREAIARQRLDAVIDFGSPALRASSGTIARLGVWSYRHGSPPRFAARPPGFRELIDGRACLYSALVSVEGDGPARLRYRSWSAVDRRSLYRTLTLCLPKLAQFPARALRAAGAPGLEGPEGEGAAAVSIEHDGRAPVPPGNVEVCAGAAILAARLARDRLRGLVQEETWYLACGFGLDPLRPCPDRLLPPPPGHFWADPFPVADADGYWIFFEEAPFRTQRGRLCVMRMDRSGRCETPVRVMDEDSHLSYPFVFRAGNQTYLVPETSATRSVRLFRAKRFPFEWEQEETLLQDVRAYDPTLAEIDGRWWMFVNLAPEGGSSWDELHLYSADRPQGPWQAHPRNPVVSDVRSARPAGHLFEHGGRRYRPAQDCSLGYGSGLVIQRIDRINPREYAEVEASRIRPDWNRRVVGVHTLNRAGDLTIMDCIYRAPRWRRSTAPLSRPGRG